MLVGIAPAAAQTIATLKTHKHTITSLAYAPDGKSLASGSKDQTVILWDLAGMKPRATLAGHKDMVITVRFSPDSKTVASVSHDDLILLWDAANGDKLGSLHGHD
jgi:WD40 repeat protein